MYLVMYYNTEDGHSVACFNSEREAKEHFGECLKEVCDATGILPDDIKKATDNNFIHIVTVDGMAYSVRLCKAESGKTFYPYAVDDESYIDLYRRATGV